MKRSTTSTKNRKSGSPSQLIDARIKELSDWRGKMLARIRLLIKQADPEVVEEWKWSVPVWSHAGIICTGETYKKVVKLTFAKGASLKDPSSLFNSSLEGNTRRAIDFHEGETIDEKALKALIRAAVALNTSMASVPSVRCADLWYQPSWWMRVPLSCPLAHLMETWAFGRKRTCSWDRKHRGTPYRIRCRSMKRIHQSLVTRRLCSALRSPRNLGKRLAVASAVKWHMR
jgi:hypothetical protein